MWAQQNAASGWKPVEDAMGRPGTVMGDVLRFGMPRKDLHVWCEARRSDRGWRWGRGQLLRKWIAMPW